MMDQVDGGSDAEEDILSAELREQLGGSSGGADIVYQRKTKAQRAPEAAAAAEPAPISKSMQRKLDSIQKRKENESKRAQYLAEIDRHKLSESHQQLMVSTRDQGQKHTSRWRLKMIIRRHKAGLTLTEEETSLLLPYMDSQLEDSSDEDKGPSKKSRAAAPTAPAAPTALAALAPAVIDPTTAALSVSAAPPVEVPVPDDGLTPGQRLMAQFRQLQSKVAADNANREVIEAAPEIDIAAEFAAKRQPHVIATGPDAMERLMAGHKDGRCTVPSVPSTRKRFDVRRDDAIQLARMQLPVCGMEQEIVEAINANDAVILCGETGSGKSTQVPQFLYEAGYCAEEGVRIGITQPRRVAASSTALRVAVEMNCPIGGPNASETDDAKEDGKKKKKKRKRQPLDGRSPQLVGYQVRHDASTVTTETCIKYMTDGILLREVTSDLLLRQYSAIILDEAHERNVNTDVLLGMLSRALVLRRAQAEKERVAYDAIPEADRDAYVRPIQPLKLIIMSATLRIDDFLNTRLFPPPLPFPPVIKVEARQYPVIPHFSKRTELHNYTKLAYKKVIQIHRKLPEGGILVFLTGRREIMQMTNKLRRYFNRRNISTAATDIEIEGCAKPVELPALWAQGDEAEDEEDRRPRRHHGESENEDSDSDSSVDDSDDFTSDEESVDEAPAATAIAAMEEKKAVVLETAGTHRNALLAQLLMGGGIHAIAEEVPVPPPSAAVTTAGNPSLINHIEVDKEERPKAALVLPLFAMLSAEQQARVFQPPPAGSRLIIIATNVAETSITIPGIKYVIDCGRYKEKVTQSASGISKYEVQWVSRASADQRMGRAGRTGPGHCYRLYSSAFYDQHMKDFQAPEILKTPLEDLLLQMRSLGIQDVERFPFPTPPTKHAVNIALSTLRNIAAVVDEIDGKSTLDALTKRTRPVTKITALGKMLAQFPIGARYAKMLVVARRSTGLPGRLVCALVASLTERPPFISRRSSFHLVGEKRGAASSESEHSGSEQRQEEEEEAAGLAFHPTSDPLARLRALGAYIHARAQANAPRSGKGIGAEKTSRQLTQFCAKHSLHQPSLERALDLTRQLIGLYDQILGRDESSEAMGSVDPIEALSPPSADEELALRQVLVTGLPDCIARRARTGAVATGSRRQRLTAYFSCNPSVTKPLYIHPESCLYRKDPTASLPEYVLYGQLVENEMGTFTYMTSVSVVDPSWITELARDCPLLHFSEPLQSPQPSYDAEADEMRCYVIPTYGIHNWELTPMKTSLAEACKGDDSATANRDIEADITALPGYRRQDEAIRWFARLLLEGSILTDPVLRGLFSKTTVKLSTSTLTSLKVTKSGAPLLLRFAKARIQSIAQLKAALKESPLFAYEELQACMHMEARKQFRLLWTRYVQDIK